MGRSTVGPVRPVFTVFVLIVPSPSLTFVVFGDTRTQHERHRAVVERVAANEPDFVLHTGDLVADGTKRAQWDLFFAIERDLLAHAPLFPVLGNHEQQAALYFDFSAVHFHLPQAGKRSCLSCRCGQ